MAIALAEEASNGMTIASQQERTPAWKRLGLKLKHASETKTVPSSTTTVVSSISLKRTVPDTRVAPKDQESVTESRSKKRRVDFRTNESNQSHSKKARTSEVLSKDKSTRLGKKVSFTAETKLEDGGKELLNEWERDDFAYYEQKAAENDAKEALKAASDAPNQPQQPTPRPQRPSDTPRKSRDALDYLTIFHRSTDSWKFNKNREVWILRHILSTDAIPTSFNIALASYVHGLRSRQARSRLLNQCYEALKKTPEEPSRDDHRSNSDSADMDDPDRRKAYHDNAVKRFKRNLEAHLDSEQRKADEDDPEYQHWLSRRKRAEILLWAVTTSNSSPDGAPSTSDEFKAESQTSANMASGSGVPPKGHISRKKNRTTVIEASSSSEEESESSDTEDDSRGGLADRKPSSNGTSDSSSSADGTSSASSSVDHDSNSDAESAEHDVRRTSSISSSEHAPGTITNGTWANRPPPLTSTSSVSNTTRPSTSAATEETSSAPSSTDDEEGDGSSTASDDQSSGSDDSEGSSNSDREDDR